MGQIPGAGDSWCRRKPTSPRWIYRADTPVAYVTQTTLSVDDTRGIIAALDRRFSDVVGPDTRDICYATQNRQTAVRELCKLVDVMLVVGASNSSNSNRLREIGAEAGMPSYLIADGDEIRPEWVRGAKAVGITAGASAPEMMVVERHRRACRASGRSRYRRCPASTSKSSSAFRSSCSTSPAHQQDRQRNGTLGIPLLQNWLSAATSSASIWRAASAIRWC